MSAYEFTVKDISGKDRKLSEFQGTVALIANTASACGYTPQYAGMQELYDRYRSRGFTVLAFPSNDFGAQEPGSEAEIAKFCDLKFKVKFPLFSKIVVKGAQKEPLFQYLTQSSPVLKGAEISWNFEKFLIDGRGQVVGRFKSGVEPLAPELTGAIEAELKKAGR